MEIEKTTIDNPPKNKGGRPLGSGHGTQIVKRLRQEIREAFRLLHNRNKPIAKLLADQIEEDACKSLNLLSKFLPQEVKIDTVNSEFASALHDVAERINQQNKILEEQSPPLVDITPDNKKSHNVSYANGNIQ